MKEENKKIQTVVDRIRVLLFNYDLAIQMAQTEIKKRTADIELYKGHGGKTGRKFLVAKVEKERYERYVNELIILKNELIEGLEIILDKYSNSYKQVFMLYFIERKSLEEIKRQTCYSLTAIKYIVNKFRSELITMFTL
jgi:DNA-directed RNA polymerase specialized sigma24 family protein